MNDSLNRTFGNEKLNLSFSNDSFKSDSCLPSKILSNSLVKISDSSEGISPSLKRKYEDDSDTLEDCQKKNHFSSSFSVCHFTTCLKGKPSIKVAALKNDATRKADKRRRNYLKKIISVSPWEFRRLKADLMESQAQRIKLEDRIDQLHKKNKEAVIFFDKEKNEMKIQLDSNRNTIKDLEYRINKIRKRETECREELNEKVKLLDLTKQKLNEKIIKLEAENVELNSKVEKYEVSSEGIVKNLKHEIQILREENEKLKLDLQEKEELYSSLQIRLDGLSENVKRQEETENQLQVAQLKIKELEKEKEDFEEARSVTMALSEKVLRIPELEKELNEKKAQVTNLRQFLHNNIMLEEMVHDLKTKLAAVEEREKETPALKARTVYLEQELEKWTSVAADFSLGSTRDSLRDYIESLQRKELTTSLEINNLNAVVQTSEKTLSSLKHELETFKMHNEKLESALKKLRIEVQVLRRKSMLISRERDSYRQQLDLYEKDLTVTGLSSETISNEVLSQMKTRIQNLEVSLSDYRKHVEALEAQLKEYQTEEGSENIIDVCKMKQEIKILEEENKRLSKMKDELEQKLENRVLKGGYASGFRVLHFRENPAAEAERKQKEDFNNLKAECDKLRARVKLLESGEVLNITQKVSEDMKNYSSQKISELEKELQSANLKMQRLKEVFKKTSQDFRDVSYMLLGYRIDLASNNKLYKLYNMYSSSPSDYLMFQHSKTGTMEMLGTTFAESLPKLVDEYLHRGNSIPAFLSAVTLELYRSSIQSDDEGDEKESIKCGSESVEAIQLD